jgi:hypothetical protein
MFTAKQLIMVIQPTTATTAEARPRQLAVLRACRYAAYTTQLTIRYVSFGSRPVAAHAASAQMAQVPTVNVQINACTEMRSTDTA